MVIMNPFAVDPERKFESIYTMREYEEILADTEK